MKKKQFIGFATSLILLMVFLPLSQTRAQIGGQTQLRPFGGLVSFPEECTCSGTTWIWFTPLYLGGPIVISGPLIYSPYSTTLYAYYYIGVPTSWHLGDYQQGGSCQIYYGYGCYDLTALGLMTKVGTSYPGFSTPQAP